MDRYDQVLNRGSVVLKRLFNPSHLVVKLHYLASGIGAGATEATLIALGSNQRCLDRCPFTLDVRKQAVERYDWKTGYRFSTYGSWWIKQAIGHALARHSRLIRLPDQVGEDLGKYIKLLDELGGRPTEAEVKNARASRGMATSGFQNAVDVYQTGLTTPIYMSTTVGEDQEDELGDLLPSQNPSPEAKVIDEVKREVVTDALEELKEKERTVIKLRFGLEDGRDRTLDEVGHELNLTRERVRQIQREALYKLRQVRSLQEIIEP